MNKLEAPRTRYYVQWDTHARHMCTLLCSLMEHGSLVDLAICCGTNTIHAHKCVLAANSPFFRDHLEKNSATEQIVILGLDFVIMKSIIEFMYCGETHILDENLKYMIAAARLFQMRGLQTLVSENTDIQKEADTIQIQTPLFLPRKPKYISAFRSLPNPVPSTSFNSFKNSPPNNVYFPKKVKRKFVGSEAEKACAKEAAASRLALEALQKELATTSQTSSFVIEESCTETTVENFIPHSEESYINQIETVPMQVVNYDELNNSILTNDIMTSKKFHSLNKKCGPSTRDLKRLLAPDIPGNVEIMFRTNEGNFVNASDDDFLNLSGGTLQYQIVDENGQVREIRELELHQEMHDPPQVPISQPLEINNDCLTSNNNSTNSDIINAQNNNTEVIANEISKSIEIEEISDSSSSTVDRLNDSTNIEHIPSNSAIVNTNGTDSFIQVLNNSDENLHVIPNESYVDYDFNRFLNLNNFLPGKDKNSNQELDVTKSPDTEFSNATKSTNTINLIKMENSEEIVRAEFNGITSDWYESKENDSKAINTAATDNLSTVFQNYLEKSCEARNNPIKKLKISNNLVPPQFSIPSVDNEVPLEMFEDSKCTERAPLKRTRANLKLFDVNIEGQPRRVYNEEHIKCDKPRRIMPLRKKKLE